MRVGAGDRLRALRERADRSALGDWWRREGRALWQRPVLAPLRRAWPWLLALGLVALVVGAVEGGRGAAGPLGLGSFEAAAADPTPLDGRSPGEPPGARQRVVVALQRPALGERADAAGLSAAAQRRYVASLRDESRSLRSALGARGVRLRDVVTFERVFNGFAATVDSRDLPGLSSLGVRPEPVRRFYPALSAPAGNGGGGAVDGPTGPTGPQGAEPAGIVAVLAAGTDAEHPALAGRLVAGYDALAGDRDAAPESDPRDPRRVESTGTALAGAVVAAGARARPIRISGLHPGAEGVEEFATTDVLIAGLERAADPDGDGDTSDHDDAALVGVNAPYAGFSDSPEGRAVAAATALGMPVVAPAGGEGGGRGGIGTVGSPAAAPGTVAVAALAAPDALPRTTLEAGDVEVPDAAVLAGAALPRRLRLSRVAIPDPVAFLRDPPALRGRAALVEAGELPAAQAAAAAAAGATLVVLAQPGDRPLTGLTAGRVTVPVVGVTGAAAEALLDADDATTLTLDTPSVVDPGHTGVETTLDAPIAPASSRGPTLDGLGKPTFAAPGAALLPVPGGGTAVVGGGAVAAARVAANLAAGGGAAGAGAVAIEPPEPGPVPDPVPLSELALTREDGRVTGVRFGVGAFERGDPFGDGTLVRAAERLDLELLDDAGRPVRRLTPPGGRRGLLPGEYAYTLPADTREALGAGRFRFRATARTPRREGVSRGLSPEFTAG